MLSEPISPELLDLHFVSCLEALEHSFFPGKLFLRLQKVDLILKF
jgi:hypothetical protein